MENCDKLGLYNACPIGALIPASSITSLGYDYSKFYTFVPKENISVDGITALAGEYLVLYDNEGYKNIHENCQKLLEYAKENGLSLGDVFYEDVILDDLSTEGYYNYLVKLSIKIN